MKNLEVRFFHGFCVLIEMKWQEGLCENSSDCLFIHGSF